MTRVVIPNSLADVVLLVGVDDNTGLHPVKDTSDINVFNLLYELEYEPHVLSAISATDMVNFFPFQHRVEGYPPDSKQESTDQKMEEMAAQRKRMMSEFTLGGAKTVHSFHPKKTIRSTSMHPRVCRSMSIRRGLSSPNTNPELPISDEVINSIASFCFPDGFCLYPAKYEPFTHAFVLSNHLGHQYASCMTLYHSYHIEKDDQDNLYIQTDLKDSWTPEDGSMRCYAPLCYVVISKFPYYNTMKECLSSMLMYIQNDPDEMFTFLKEYANVLTHTPVPPAGNLSVIFKIHDLPLTLMPSTHPGKLVIDLPLHLVFQCFSADEFLKILACILVEERIVFLSSNYSLLTIIMESIMNMILPFKWRFTYSTILPATALAYLESPGVFMYGVHSRNKEEVRQVGDLVLVDIDEGTVQVANAEIPEHGSQMNGNSEPVEIPSLPQVAANAFKSKWSLLKLQLELLETRQPVCYNMLDFRRTRTKRIFDQNSYIAKTCLELMVNLFRDVVTNLRVEHTRFDKEKFLEEHEADKIFYERIFKTDMFKIFLKERLEKPDYWSEVEMKSRGFSTSSLNSKPRRYTLTNVMQGEKRDITVLELPEITDLKEYLKSAIKNITKLIEETDDYDYKTSLHYMRALFYHGDGNYEEAMNEFINITATNKEILPVKVLSDLFGQLSEKEKIAFRKKQGHDIILDLIEEVGNERNTKIKMDPIAIPEADLNYYQFEDFMLFKQMADDYKTIERLFEALTQEKISSAPVLKQMTFQFFVACWESNQYQCKQLKIEDGYLAEEEMILKVSTLIKTDFGLGRIGLTDKRIFFLSDVSNKYQEVAKLREIKELEKSEHNSLFSKSSVLKIHRKEKRAGSFTAHLKEERNWWYIVIQEMWAGKVVAEAQKDVMMVQQAIKNTLIVDAIIESGQSDFCTHSQNVEAAAEKMCYFSKCMKEGNYILPKDTQDALQHRINANAGEKESRTVSAILYTGGNESMCPRIWCGLSDGRIKVYNAITMAMESEITVDPKQYVACLTSVNDQHVWAGTSGIYIMDSLTLTCKKTLHNHKSLVVAIIPYDNNRYVYTASLDGNIIKWNSQKLTVIEKKDIRDILELRSLIIHNDRLICGSWSKIVICDLEGSSLKQLSVPPKEKSKVVELDSFTVTVNNEIWAGSRREGKLYIWDMLSGDLEPTILSINSKGVCSMKEVDGRIWTGTKDGLIYIYSVSERKLWKMLRAHEDAVRVLCDVRDRCHRRDEEIIYQRRPILVRYVISGGGSNDGRICIWNATGNAAAMFAEHSDEH